MSSYAEHPAAGSPDGLLVRAYLDGDSAAFDVLYTRYFDCVRRYVQARVGGDYLTAEDLAQEAMTRALDRLDGFDQTRPFLPYVYKIAYHLLPAHWRKETFERPVEEFRDDAASIPDDTERIVTIGAVNDALAKLPPRQRNALYMRYAEDRDGNELAAFFGLTRNAFEQLLSRARKAMKREYRGPAVLVPGLPGLLARLRRFSATAGARLQVASGATASVAGELAIGAAITVGGIGLVINATAPDAAGERVVRTVASDRGVIAYERSARALYSGLPYGTGGADGRGAVGTLSGERPGTVDGGAERWDTGAAGDETGGAASDGTIGGVSAEDGEPIATGDDVTVSAATPWGHEAPGTPDAPQGGVYVAPPNVDAPAPNAEVWIDDDSAGAEAGSDEAGTSGDVALNRKIAQEGEVLSNTVETNLTGEGDSAVITVENSGDGGLSCDLAGVCVPI